MKRHISRHDLRTVLLCTCLGSCGTLTHAGSFADGAPTTAPTTDPEASADQTHLPLHITGGHDTEGGDRGRPVILVASALNVPAAVFREAFTHVHPAGPGQQPQEDQVRQNKRALMEKLSPYGVTDDRLNEVSNYYRYQRGAGEMWKHSNAEGYAIVRDGKLQSVVITNVGAGYSTPPTVTIDSMPDTHLIATLSFGTDLKTNGSLHSVAIAPTSAAVAPAEPAARSAAP